MVARLIAIVVSLAGAGAVSASASGLVVDTKDRSDVVRFYQTTYLASEEIAAGWTGRVSGCDAGTVDAAYLDAGLLRIRYFRVMAGLPDGLIMNSALNAKCQKAALMMTANRSLSHSPPASWRCYTSAGAEAASKSNLAYGYGSLPAAVTGWIMDKATPSLGHRRWILYPPLLSTGLGATPEDGHGGYSMWVSGVSGARPPGAEWISWPSPGYVPYQVTPTTYWSFSYPRADFSAASIRMTKNGVPIGTKVQSLAFKYGDNTIAWKPTGLSSAAPSTDVRYRVTVKNVRVGGVSRTFTYESIVIDPDRTVSVEEAGEAPGGGSR